MSNNNPNYGRPPFNKNYYEQRDQSFLNKRNRSDNNYHRDTREKRENTSDEEKYIHHKNETIRYDDKYEGGRYENKYENRNKSNYTSM